MCDRRCSIHLVAVGAGLAVALAISPLAQAQETTSQLTGFVVDAEGRPIEGAQVSIVHLPSGTATNVTTGASGQFSATGLRVGGPYRVAARVEGMQESVVEDLFAQLAQRSSVTLVAQPITQLTGVEVIGAAERDVTIGAGSRYNSQDIRELPSISRDIKDVVRIDPKAWVDPTNSDALEIAGVNNRYNTVTVDGVRQSDDFGLNNNGYPTQRSPLSIDAIQAVSILTAPFSVEYGHFRGSTINVVTKSGTNDFTGSAYYYKGSDSLIGDRSKDISFEDVVFSEKTYGGTFGGPILKDRLFFFLSYEKLDKSAPQLFGPAGSGFPEEVSGVTQAEYDDIARIAQSVYGFDIGEQLTSLPEKDEKILAKLDWNINDSHRAAVAYQRTEGNEIITSNNGFLNRVSASSNWYNRAITLDSASLQLFSDWNGRFSTELKLARKEIEVRQDSLQGADFAEMQIRTLTGGTMFIGPDEFRHANFLTNDLDAIKLKGNFFLGDHTVTTGYEREMLDIFNLFVARSQGQYRFSSIANFENRIATNLNYTNSFTNDANDGAGAFDFDIDSFYVQDEWQITPDLKIQAGVRLDKFTSGDEPLLNDKFTSRYGFSNQDTLDGRDLFMPRIGFNWQWRPETTIYGGFGLFGGGTPNVWVSNSFSNDGVVVQSTNVSNIVNTQLISALSNVDGFDLPQNVLDHNSTQPRDGAVNAIDPKFDIPSQWRWNLGIKQTLPWDVELTADVIVSRVKDEVLWKDIRLSQTGTAPDGRPRYSPLPDGRSDSTIQDFLLTNTSDGKGTVFTVDLSKTWRTRAGRFDAYLGYGHQDIEDVNPGTSSQASSNWDRAAVADPNDPGLGTSIYEIEHQFKGALTWHKSFFGDYATSVALVGERRSGRPYSFTFGGGTPQSVFGDPRQGSRQRQLFYVPASPTDVIYEVLCTTADVSGEIAGCRAITDVNAANSAAFAVATEAYIQQFGLDKYRGRIVPRNSHSSPWLSVLDLRLSQELPVWRKSRGVLTLDIENLANMIDSDWGQLRQVAFHYVAPVLDVNRIDAATNRYVYRPRSGQTGPVAPAFVQPDGTGSLASIWKIQLGVRFEF